VHEFFVTRQSVIHRADARVKLLLTLVFIIFISLLPARSWAAFLLYLSLIISLAILSSVGYRQVLKRSLFALPFILAAVPLIFLGPLPHINIPLAAGMNLNVSPAGSMRFLGIALKSWLCVQAAVILVATTQFSDIVTAMKQLHVPPVLTSIVGLMWRYLFVIVDEGQRLMRARLSRSAVSIHSGFSIRKLFWQAKVTGGMAGSLFLRSLERSERVYAAMVSRGYNVGLTTNERSPLSKQSWQVLGGGCLVALIILLFASLIGG